MRIQWSRMDRELFWWLTIGWIPGLFTPLCHETCVATECLGKIFIPEGGGGPDRGSNRPSGEQSSCRLPGVLTTPCPLRPVDPSRAFVRIHSQAGGVLGARLARRFIQGPVRVWSPLPALHLLLCGDPGVHARACPRRSAVPPTPWQHVPRAVLLGKQT